MKIITELADKVQKETYLLIQYRLLSILQRLMFIAFGLCIIYNNIYYQLNNNYYNADVYILISTLYLFLLLSILYLITKFSPHFNYTNVLCFFIDCLYVFFILIYKDLQYFLHFIFFILPIIFYFISLVSNNDIYVFTTHILLLLFLNSYSVNLNVTHNKTPLFILLFILYTVGIVIVVNMKILKFERVMNSSISKYFRNKSDVFNNFIVYDDLLFGINKYILNNYFYFYNRAVSVVCFEVKLNDLEVKQNDLYIINSSYVIYNYSIALNKDQWESLNSGETIYNLICKFNDLIIKYSILIPIKSDNNIYAFCISFHKIYLNVGFSLPNTLKPILSNIASVLIAEKNQFNNRNVYFDKIRSDLQYVNTATIILHYLRNKFSSVTNYFAMINKPDGIEDIIEKQKPIAQLAVLSILERTNHILDRKNNPFLLKNFTYSSVDKIFLTIRHIWEHILWENILNNSKSVSANFIQSSISTYIKIDEEGLDILFTDLIENVRRHSEGYCKIEFLDDEKFLYINIYNNYKLTPFNKDFVENQYVKYFNEESNFEIRSKDSYGIIIIKNFMKQLEIGCNVVLYENIICMKITFRKVIQ